MSLEVSFEVERVIEEHHPALAGHFRGNPIVPGVLILDEVVQATREWRGRTKLHAIESVKFSSPLKPGERFRIELREAGRSKVAFECRHAGTTLARGTLRMEFDASVS